MMEKSLYLMKTAPVDSSSSFGILTSFYISEGVSGDQLLLVMGHLHKLSCMADEERGGWVSFTKW